MKTKSKKQNQNTGLLSRPEQLSTELKTPEAKKRPVISMKRRFVNRTLPVDKLLTLLRSEAPRFFELAEVVGKWVWIQFEDKQPSSVTRILAELGLHWNNCRQSWQHPCGTIADKRTEFDPRERYGSYFAADRLTV